MIAHHYHDNAILWDSMEKYERQRKRPDTPRTDALRASFQPNETIYRPIERALELCSELERETIERAFKIQELQHRLNLRNGGDYPC